MQQYREPFRDFLLLKASPTCYQKQRSIRQFRKQHSPPKKEIPTGKESENICPRKECNQKAPGTGLPGTVEQVVHSTFCHREIGAEIASLWCIFLCHASWHGTDLFQKTGSFLLHMKLFHLASQGPQMIHLSMSYKILQFDDTRCSQPITPSCIQALSPKLCCAILLLLEDYSAPFIVSGLCHMYCFSSQMLYRGGLKKCYTEAAQRLDKMLATFLLLFFSLCFHHENMPRLAHWRKRHMEQEHQVTPAPGDKHSKPSDMERAQSRSVEPPTSLGS